MESIYSTLYEQALRPTVKFRNSSLDGTTKFFWKIEKLDSKLHAVGKRRNPVGLYIR